MDTQHVLEHKFCRFGEAIGLGDGAVISGYASLFGTPDHGGDIVQKGAYAGSLSRLETEGRQVKMLWQHDPAQPIGVWESVREDSRGLYVKGRLLDSIERGREAAVLVAAGAIDGLSIGYRTVAAGRTKAGRRVLNELELWEVSLVTFPMLPMARVVAKRDHPHDDSLRDLAAAFEDARRTLARPGRA